MEALIKAVGLRAQVTLWEASGCCPCALAACSLRALQLGEPTSPKSLKVIFGVSGLLPISPSFLPTPACRPGPDPVRKLVSDDRRQKLRVLRHFYNNWCKQHFYCISQNSVGNTVEVQKEQKNRTKLILFNELMEKHLSGEFPSFSHTLRSQKMILCQPFPRKLAIVLPLSRSLPEILIFTCGLEVRRFLKKDFKMLQ